MKLAALQTDRKQFFCKLVILYQSMFLSTALSIGQKIFIYQNMQIGLTTLPPPHPYPPRHNVPSHSDLQWCIESLFFRRTYIHIFESRISATYKQLLSVFVILVGFYLERNFKNT